jgi:hypothetical protein
MVVALAVVAADSELATVEAPISRLTVICGVCPPEVVYVP